MRKAARRICNVDFESRAAWSRTHAPRQRNCWLSVPGNERKKARTIEQAAIKNENLFAVLMEACKYCSLGQLTEAMFEVGGQYRRNM